MAHRTGALATKDLEQVAVDTTVQPKNVAFPSQFRALWPVATRPCPCLPYQWRGGVGGRICCGTEEI